VAEALAAARARRALGRGLALEDLLAEGLLAADEAVDDYALAWGGTLDAYVTTRVRTALLAAVDGVQTVRLPRELRRAVAHLAEAAGTLPVQLGRLPTEAELAATVALPAPILRALRPLERPPRSAAAGFGGEEAGDSETLSDDDEAALSDDAADLAEREALSVAVRLVLATLPERERQVIDWRFGLDDGCERSPAEIGERLGLTPAEVVAIEVRARSALTQRSRSGVLAPYHLAPAGGAMRTTRPPTAALDGRPGGPPAPGAASARKQTTHNARRS
jgi:RNA polymerase primary sigma factor